MTPTQVNKKNIAIKVLTSEIQSLQTLMIGLDFSKVEVLVDAIMHTSGKIVICGIGKSGYIANKIAATICSIGMPTVFLHAAEACHGDLGVISSNDIVIVFSNSGEGYELKNVVKYCKFRKINLVGISRDPFSMLAQHSDISITLPQTPEASDLDIPTTSTMMMLAFGDMLGILLKETRNLSYNEYITYHPGGKIGFKGLKASDVMYSGDAMPLVSNDANIIEILKVMSAKRLGCAMVTDKQTTGIITDDDLKRFTADEVRNIKATDIARQIEYYISPDIYVVDILKSFESQEHIVIIDNDMPVGIILHSQLSELTHKYQP